jgi:hypothetical protein
LDEDDDEEEEEEGEKDGGKVSDKGVKGGKDSNSD